MTANLPDHVVRALAPPKPRFSIPARPTGSPYEAAQGRVGQLALVYGPFLLLALIASSGAGSRWMVWLPSAVLGSPLVVCATWRVPQEFRRSRKRGWARTADGDTLAWDDPSGEWQYARWQSRHLAFGLQWLVALTLVAAWCWGLVHVDTWGLFFLIPAIAVLVYVHRHLPTRLRRLERFHACYTCHKVYGEDGPPRCPRCGRISDLYTRPAVPALQRRFRDL